jgi:hypothetical protein
MENLRVMGCLGFEPELPTEEPPTTTIMGSENRVAN